MWNARARETLAKEVVTKLDSHPPWTVAAAHRPPVLAFNHMSVVLLYYLNVVPVLIRNSCKLRTKSYILSRDIYMYFNKFVK